MPLYLACDDADYNQSTGECSAPYYAQPPEFLPDLSATDGLQIGFAIVGIWTLGLVARVFIRTGQEAQRH